MERYLSTSKTKGFIKLRLSPKEMRDIRQQLETATEEAFEEFDRTKQRTWTDARRIIL